MSGGELKVTVYAGGELVPPFGTQQAVENGTAQAYHGSGSWFAGRDISHAFFFSGPFGLLFDEMHAWMYYGGGQELLDEFTNPRGLQIFIGGGSGVQTFGWFKKPINSLGDLKGLNFRVTGFGASVLNKIGMNAVSTPPGEIFPALQSGALDGAEWVGPAFDQAFGLQKIMSHMYTPSFGDVYGGIEYGINLEAWNALSEDLQTIVVTATEAEANRSSADALNMNLDGLSARESRRPDHGHFARRRMGGATHSLQAGHGGSGRHQRLRRQTDGQLLQLCQESLGIQTALRRCAVGGAGQIYRLTPYCGAELSAFSHEIQGPATLAGPWFPSGTSQKPRRTGQMCHLL